MKKVLVQSENLGKVLGLDKSLGEGLRLQLEPREVLNENTQQVLASSENLGKAEGSIRLGEGLTSH